MLPDRYRRHCWYFTDLFPAYAGVLPRWQHRRCPKGSGGTSIIEAVNCYSNSYRITARFLVWLEQHGYPKLVNALDRAARLRTYSSGIWQRQTGRTLDELWAAYTAEPAVQLAYR